MVGIYVDLSPHSQKLLGEFQRACGLEQEQHPPIPVSLELSSLLSWFHEQLALTSSLTHSQQEMEFLLLSLRTELLHDLCLVMDGDVNIANKAPNNLSWHDTIKLGLLTSAGILVAACEGFDCVVTMMSIFAVPSAVILASGLIFSSLSIVAFCGLELVRLSASLDIKITDAYKLLDVYLQQFDEVKRIRKKISKYSLSKLPENELEALKQIIIMLEQRFTQLRAAGEQFEQALNSGTMQLVKLALSAIAAALFFGGSFCAAQTASLYLFGLIMTSVTPVSLPVLLCSTLVGMAALSLYWCVEFPGLQSVVADWLGLDEAKITALCSSDSLESEQKKLSHLKESIGDILSLKQQLPKARQNSETKDEPENEIHRVTSPRTPIKVSASGYSFIRGRQQIQESTPKFSVELTLGTPVTLNI